MEEIQFSLCLFAIVSLLVFFCYSCEKNSNDKKIKENISYYSSFSVNGEKFSTDDIKYFESTSRAYSSNTVVFYLKDETKIETLMDSITWYKN